MIYTTYMLKLSATLLDVPIMSIRTGGEVARTESLLINPNNLKIEGFYCTDRFSNEPLLLLPQDIREVLPQGLAVNDHEVLVEPEELVRLKDIIAIDFQIIGKYAVSEQRKKLGKIVDFAIETSSLYVQKLYVQQSLIRNFNGGQLSIDRSRIIETSPDAIMVSTDTSEPVTAPAAA